MFQDMDRGDDRESSTGDEGVRQPHTEAATLGCIAIGRGGLFSRDGPNDHAGTEYRVLEPIGTAEIEQGAFDMPARLDESNLAPSAQPAN